MIAEFSGFLIGFICGGIVFGVAAWLGSREHYYRTGVRDMRLMFYSQRPTPKRGDDGTDDKRFVVLRETGRKRAEGG